MTEPNTNLSQLTETTGLLSVVMPVYNELAYIHQCVERVLAADLPANLSREIIIVDDASTDGTRQRIEQFARQHPRTIRAFFKQKNRGKGAAVRRALREIRGQYVIFQDGDLEYHPRDYARLLQPLLDGKADVVYGSRFMPHDTRRPLDYHQSLGNRLLTCFSNRLTGLNLTDMETCYKAFRADLLRTIPIRSNRFGIEPEITAKVAKRGAVVCEVPIDYHGRGYSEGKKLRWKDGLSAFGTILKYWLIDDCLDDR